MQYILKREYYNSEKNISFNDFCQNYYNIWEKLIKINDINLNQNKAEEEKKQIILINLKGYDINDRNKDIFLKYKNFIYLGEDLILKLIIEQKLEAINNAHNLSNSIFKIAMNYCFINGFSFIWQTNLEYIEFLLFYIDLAKKFGHFTEICIIKNDLINNYITYICELYKDKNENESLGILNEINIFLYIKSNLNISRLIFQKEKSQKSLYIPNEIKINIFTNNKEEEQNKFDIINFKDNFFKILNNEKEFKLFKIFQENLNKLEIGKNLIEEIIKKENKEGKIMEYNIFGNLYNNLLESNLYTECNFNDYVFLDESYKYESILNLPNEVIEAYIKNKFHDKKDMEDYYLLNKKFKDLTNNQIIEIKDLQLLKNCPENLKKQIVFIEDKEKINYQVIIENGTLLYLKDKRVIDSYNEYYKIFGEYNNKELNIGIPGKSKFSCFIIDVNDNIYIYPFKTFKIHHSFITKGNILNKLAGMIYIRNGKIYHIENRSGHYKTAPKQIDILFEKLKQLSMNDFPELFNIKFDINRKKFSENILEIVDKEEFGLNLLYANENNADIIRQRIKNKYFNIIL